MNHISIKPLIALVVLALLAAACVAQPRDDTSQAAQPTTSEPQPEAEVETEGSVEDEVEAEGSVASDTEVLGVAQEAPDSDGESPDEGETAIELEFAGQVLEVTGPEISESNWAAIQRALNVFAAQTGAEVIYTGLGDWEAEMAVRINAGRAPAVSIFPHPSLVAEFASSDSIVRLPREVTSVVANAWARAHLEAGNIDGAQFAVPVDAGLSSAIWFDTNVFGAGGYTVPQSVTELETLTEIMIRDGIVPWCLAGDADGDLGSVFSKWVEAIVLSDHGQEVYDQWVAGEIGFSDFRIVGSMSTVRNLWTTPGAVNGGVELILDPNAASPADLHASFLAGECAMTLQDAEFARGLPGDADHLDWFAFPSSAGDGAAIIDGGHVAAFTATPAALALVAFMASADYAQIRQRAQRSVAGNRHSSFSTANGQVDRSLWSDRNAEFIEFLATVEAVRPEAFAVLTNDADASALSSQATAFIRFQLTGEDFAGALDAARPAQ